MTVACIEQDAGLGPIETLQPIDSMGEIVVAGKSVIGVSLSTVT